MNEAYFSLANCVHAKSILIKAQKLSKMDASKHFATSEDEITFKKLKMSADKTLNT